MSSQNYYYVLVFLCAFVSYTCAVTCVPNGSGCSNVSCSGSCIRNGENCICSHGGCGDACETQHDCKKSKYINFSPCDYCVPIVDYLKKHIDIEDCSQIDGEITAIAIVACEEFAPVCKPLLMGMCNLVLPYVKKFAQKPSKEICSYIYCAQQQTNELLRDLQFLTGDSRSYKAVTSQKIAFAKNFVDSFETLLDYSPLRGEKNTLSVCPSRGRTCSRDSDCGSKLCKCHKYGTRSMQCGDLSFDLIQEDGSLTQDSQWGELLIVNFLSDAVKVKSEYPSAGYYFECGTYDDPPKEKEIILQYQDSKGVCVRGMSWTPSGAEATVSFWIKEKLIGIIRYGSPYINDNYIIPTYYDQNYQFNIEKFDYSGPLGMVKVEIKALPKTEEL